MADIDLTPTEEMAANAKRGLELRRKHGRGGTAVGVARARDISNRKTLSPETVRRMHAFFSRHEKNKAGGEDDAGYIAWMLWSGDAGQGWAKRKVEQMDKSENQRSETYKAIAERLGSAATNDRPGAKAKMGANVRRGVDPKKGGQWITGTWDGGTWSAMVFSEPSEAYGIPEFPHISKLAINPKDKPGIGGVIVNYDRGWDIKPSTPELQKAYREIAQAATAEVKKAVSQGWYSRSGAKATMGMVEQNLYKLLKSWYALAEEGNPAFEAAEAMRIAKRALSLPDYRPTGSTVSSHKMANELLDAIRTNYSRPGAKASFAQNARAVAQEILRQLGGGRFMAMVGGKNAMHGTFGGKPGLQVSIGKGAEGGINRLIVTLDPATDTYNMEFWRIGNRGLSTKKVSEASMVYADDLQRVFTDRTKFYTSMSRPGAKARFADGTDSFLTIKGVRYRIAGMRKDAKGNLVYDLHGTSKTAHPVTYTLVKFLDDQRWVLWGAQGQEVARGKMEASRPGAKDTNAVREGSKISAEDEACLKVMSAADAKVSDKIRTLIAEGKPQKQAVAIALDLKRRGEL